MRSSRTEGLVGVAMHGLFSGLHSLDREVELVVSIIPGNPVLWGNDVPCKRRPLLKSTLGLVDRPPIDLKDCCAGIEERHSDGLRNVAPTNRSDGRDVILRVSHFVVIPGSVVLNEKSGCESDR